jgi:hypothetical protein
MTKQALIQVHPVMTKARKRFGTDYPAQPTTHNADVVKNETIRIFGNYCSKDYDKTFKVGDIAEYDSYNLSYMGTIVSISDKGVGILPQHGCRGGKVQRLGLDEFCWRNHNLDVAAKTAENHETMMYI